MKKIHIIFTFILLLFPINIVAMELPSLHSANVILYDLEEKEILYENGSNEIINIASLTKIMTTIVAIENIENLDQYVTITNDMLREVPYDASISGLKEGDTVPFIDLLYASILPSGADATTALAHGICGKTDKFIELMNKKAESLNLENTHFANVTGYDAPNHYSTPKEVLKILLYALDNPLFDKIYKTKEYTLDNGLEVKSTLNYYNKNTNYDLTSIIGSKTGFTSKAGLCMSSIIKVVDKDILLLTFGAKRNNYKDAFNVDDAVTVMNYLNDNYKNQIIYKKGEVLFNIPVTNSNIDYYEVKVVNDFIIYTNEINKNDVKYEYNGLENLCYKNKKGDKIGTITYHYQNKSLTEDIYLNQDIKFSIIKYFKSNLEICLPAIIIFIIFTIISLKIVNKKRKNN